MSGPTLLGATTSATRSLAATVAARWRSAERGWRATCWGVAVVALHLLAQGA